MDQYNYHIEKIRFHIQEENTLLVRGWFRQDNPKKRIPAFYLDSEKLEYELNIKKGVNVRQRYRMYQADVSQEVLCTLKLPDNWKSCGELRITTVQGTTNHDVAKISVSELVALRENLDYNIDSEALVNGKIKITGWVMGKEPVDLSTFTGFERCGLCIECRKRTDLCSLPGSGSSHGSVSADICPDKTTCRRERRHLSGTCEFGVGAVDAGNRCRNGFRAVDTETERTFRDPGETARQN